MGRTDNEIDCLVDDSDLLIKYQVRAGVAVNPDFIKLTSDIARKREAQVDVETGSINQLRLLLNSSLRLTPHINLIDVGSKWRPFHTSRLFSTFFCMMTTLIVIGAMFSTYVYIRQVGILGELTDVSKWDLEHKVHRIDAADPRLVGTPIYTDQLDELLSYNAKLQEYEREYDDWYNNPIIRAVLSGHRLINAPSQKAIGGPKYNDTRLDSAPQSPAALQTPANDVQSADATQKFLIANNLGSIYQEIYGPKVSPDDHRTETEISYLGESLDWLGSFVLPGLYGLIGILIYELRRVLDPLLPSTPMERILVRCTLGAFAGLSLTFLLRPFEIGHDKAFTSISTFGVAFLLGFSLDGFFTVLDRLVKGISKIAFASAKL